MPSSKGKPTDPEVGVCVLRWCPVYIMMGWMAGNQVVDRRTDWSYTPPQLREQVKEEVMQRSHGEWLLSDTHLMLAPSSTCWRCIWTSRTYTKARPEHSILTIALFTLFTQQAVLQDSGVPRVSRQPLSSIFPSRHLPPSPQSDTHISPPQRLLRWLKNMKREVVIMRWALDYFLPLLYTLL